MIDGRLELNTLEYGVFLIGVFVFITAGTSKIVKNFNSSSPRPSFFKIKRKATFKFNFVKFVPTKTFSIR